MSTAGEVTAFIVAEYLPGTSSDELESSYDLIDTGVVDSLGLLQLIAWVEKRYAIPIDDVEISPENFRSVDAICEFVTATSKP
jgi:acyl carrier protein